MGMAVCSMHGLDPACRWVSLRFRDLVTVGGSGLHDGRWVPILYPDQSAVDVAFLHAEDRSRLGEYTSGRGSIHPAHRATQARLPSEVLPSLLTVFHERERRRLNDKVFIVKATPTLGAVCAACLRETLRREDLVSDRDFAIPLLSERRLCPASPSVLRALGLDEDERSYF